jgi:hypothetical protein
MTPLTIECDVHFRRCGRGNGKKMRAGEQPAPVAREPGRVPRVARTTKSTAPLNSPYFTCIIKA